MSFKRLQELARRGAWRQHCEEMHLEAFKNCPHPDCVLVRTPPQLVTSRQIAFDHAGMQQWGDDVPCWIYAGEPKEKIK